MRLQNVIYGYAALSPETHTERHATQHGCLPSFLTMGTNFVWWGKKDFVLDQLEQPRQNKNLVYRHKPNQGRTPFMCTLWVSIHLCFSSLFRMQRKKPFSVKMAVSRARLLLMILLLLLLPIVTIIAVAAFVVAAVDGFSEGRRFAPKCGWNTAFPRS